MARADLSMLSKDEVELIRVLDLDGFKLHHPLRFLAFSVSVYP